MAEETMIYYRCFVCGAEMDSPSCLVGQTEECPDCGFSNWVPYPNSAGPEGAQPSEGNADGRPGKTHGLKGRILGALARGIAWVSSGRSRGRRQAISKRPEQPEPAGERSRAA
ncbi:MAG: hypothetical protein ACYS8K_09875 [Planctomycetota bacterium]